ncbi:MAG: hypothetical protein IJR50_08750 [Treponema sp.]|nr:hypothetical protein [Treponema sp.]
METKDLTGIERQLVLQYLIDGNVPVTVTPIEKNHAVSEDEKIKPVSSAVFPVALKAEQITVSDKGIILLKNPPQSVLGFAGKYVRVEFYFNSVGLFFTTEMRSSKYGLALVIPEAIRRIQDVEAKQEYDFFASVFYSCSNKAVVNFDCVPCNGYELFARPVWSAIRFEEQQEAKKYLEQFVAEAKKEKNAGNGLQLISICRYLTEKTTKIEQLEGRVKPLAILYVDHERIVLGSDNIHFPFAAGTEYALKMSFSLKTGPVVSREVIATCALAKIYRSNDGTRACADCVYTSMQEEDRRFIYEKATKQLFV